MSLDEALTKYDEGELTQAELEEILNKTEN